MDVETKACDLVFEPLLGKTRRGNTVLLSIDFPADSNSNRKIMDDNIEFHLYRHIFPFCLECQDGDRCS